MLMSPLIWYSRTYVMLQFCRYIILVPHQIWSSQQGDVFTKVKDRVRGFHYLGGCVFICVCLLVGRITQKVPDGSAGNLVKGWGSGKNSFSSDADPDHCLSHCEKMFSNIFVYCSGNYSWILMIKIFLWVTEEAWAFLCWAQLGHFQAQSGRKIIESHKNMTPRPPTGHVPVLPSMP